MKIPLTKLFLSIACVLLYGGTSSFSQEKSDPAAEAKIEDLIRKMTLEEKIGMIHANSSFTSTGVPRLGVPELTTSDGPHGVRPEHGRDWVLDNKGNDSSTYLPTGITLASTWNPELGYAFGAVLGSEAKYRGKDVILGPGINIIRTPLNGRNFEYMSEDPYLISKMVVGYIKGVQDQGISASLKHFMGNNQEIRRDGINVEMSERALREIYLPGFKAAVIEGEVNTVMGSYNKLRGEYCTYNDYLINKILKGEWGFRGLVMSDWGAIHSTKEALLGGADLEMGTDLSMLPNPDYNKFYFADPALKMVRSGEVSEKVIDDKVRRILRIMFKTHMFDKRTPGELATKEHAAVAKKVAEEGIILLQNKKNILPVSKMVKTIAVIGANANRENAMGGGSSQVRPPYEVTLLAGLQNLAGSDAGIRFEQGYTIARNAKADPSLIQKAVDAAKHADIAIVAGGWIHGYDYSKWDDNAYDAEGFDKPSMEMPFGQDELITAVARANPNTIVVLYGGGPIDMSAWVNKVKGIIQAGYPGMEGGSALAEIILGKVNPSGKLTVTFPKKLQDSPAHKLGEYPGDSVNVHYNEDIFVGYRYFDTYKVKPQFAFGHGLSYTTFEYGKLSAATVNGDTFVRLNVKNTGTMAGAEIVQIYVHDKKASLKRPEKELKSFSKIFLAPGEVKELIFKLDKEAFSFFDSKQMEWVLEPGGFEILAGSSSVDIRSKVEIRL
ncbi:glycoside hydrolase family 3 C-terminal domain-containing protein [Arcticibacter tournemirensis]|uniref:Glycosyl hydrolase n=1 Tax=Arcticibacter tournemirensis TaxID=699437 RepID=A0A4Q0M2R7_9SPHI|nr:glycoside hydrolase family 3 C-terminal domain-containing protein [Arcticibacter tournemirensis]RXF67191.1 glycosyl hydrolase [Arcticibacter tournemirensis]